MRYIVETIYIVLAFEWYIIYDRDHGPTGFKLTSLKKSVRYGPWGRFAVRAAAQFLKFLLFGMGLFGLLKFIQTAKTCCSEVYL